MSFKYLSNDAFSDTTLSNFGNIKSYRQFKMKLLGLQTSEIKCFINLLRLIWYE